MKPFLDNARVDLCLRDANAFEYALDRATKPLLVCPEVWIARPVLGEHVIGFRNKSALRKVIEPLRRDPPFGRSFMEFRVDDHNVLYAWSTVNEYRCLGGRRLDALRAPKPSPVLRVGPEMWATEVRALHVGRRLSVATNSVGVPAFVARRVARLATYAHNVVEEMIECTAPSAVVAGSQHLMLGRALAWSARQRRIPSIYVPHAPISMKRQYADLPFDYGALRGQQGIDFYRALGADAVRLKAIGDLSLDDMHSSGQYPNDRVVVAPSPWSRHKVKRFLEIVNDGVDDFDVYPHPRSDVRLLKRASRRNVNVVEGVRTVCALREGAAAVIQHGSGIALEAMLLGIPVIEILLDADRPRSPMTREPHAYIARDSSELRRSLEIIRRGEPSNRVLERVEWARRWCDATGAESQRRLDRLLSSSLRAEGPLVDSWSPERLN